MSALETRILEAVKAGFGTQMELTERLVTLPSRRNEEHAVQELMAEEFARRGYAVERVPIDEETLRGHPGFSPISESASTAPNIVATHLPRAETGRSLILNGHVDVVPEGPPEMWDGVPFQPRREGDWLYGRGGGDMKAGLVAAVAALDALRSLGYQPAARVHIESVVEEESTGNGALACLAAGYRADAALIPEPIDERLVRANCGVLWFEVAVAGTPVHAHTAGTGANAIDAGVRVIASLRVLEELWNEEAASHPRFAHMNHPLNLVIGRIEGGDWPSSVPAWCKLQCRIAILPGDDPAARAKEIEKHLADDLAGDAFLAASPPEIRWTGFFAQGYVLDEGSDAEDVLARAHRQAIGSTLQSCTFPAYLDGRVFAVHADMPCLVYGPVAESIHGFNERVSLSSLKRITGAIALFIADWCGLEKIDG